LVDGLFPGVFVEPASEPGGDRLNDAGRAGTGGGEADVLEGVVVGRGAEGVGDMVFVFEPPGETGVREDGLGRIGKAE
jgi:hypothetical protein